tara:strand:- start:1879 stop:3111 length:1233 start_codon:yes stop_codon:yes gene_type:complete
MSVNKFPPKFSQNILYPAEYDLESLPIPPQNDYLNMGVFFNMQFGGYGVNSIPTLSYGKHKFDVILIPHSSNSAYPKLQPKSRVLFEVKDVAGNLIFSDITPIYKDNGFTGYLWIKQDPLRTFKDIQEGYGYVTIVAKAQTTDPQWKNRYNVRVRQKIYVNLFDYNTETGQISGFKKNYSPILFQKHTGSLGSGSGNLIVSEGSVINEGVQTEQSALIVSMSNMKTYSGKVNRIYIEYKLSGSSGDTSNPSPEWSFFGDWTLISKSYEDNIYKDYGVGINTLDENFSIPIFSSQIPHGGWDGSGTNKVKFRFRFVNPGENFAEDMHTSVGYFQLDYPKNNDEWLVFEGSNFVQPGSSVFAASNPIIVETVKGQFSFDTAPLIYEDGQSYSENGNPNNKEDIITSPPRHPN